MSGLPARVAGLLRGFGARGDAGAPWDCQSQLVPVRSRIARLDAACPPDLVHEVHLEVLSVFGRSIGADFHPWPPIEPPTEGLISVAGRFDERPGERDFGLLLQPEEIDDGRLVRVAWLIDLYLPKSWRRRGAGTALMEVLLELWERIGVGAVRTTATAEGRLAYLSWGFSEMSNGGTEDGLTEMRLKLPLLIARPTPNTR